MNYKATLNLPKTGFPMKADLPVREPSTLQQWDAQGLYERLRRARAVHSGRVLAPKMGFKPKAPPGSYQERKQIATAWIDCGSPCPW